MDDTDFWRDDEPMLDDIAWLRLVLARYRASRAHEPDSYAARHLREYGHDLAPGCCSAAYDRWDALRDMPRGAP